MRFGGRTIGGNAGPAIIEIGPPHVVGRTYCSAYRAHGKQGIGMAEEVHDPRMWTTPLGNHGAASLVQRPFILPPPKSEGQPSRGAAGATPPLLWQCSMMASW